MSNDLINNKNSLTIEQWFNEKIKVILIIKKYKDLKVIF